MKNAAVPSRESQKSRHEDIACIQKPSYSKIGTIIKSSFPILHYLWAVVK